MCVTVQAYATITVLVVISVHDWEAGMLLSSGVNGCVSPSKSEPLEQVMPWLEGL